jgi:chemotaxis protein MotB
VAKKHEEHENHERWLVSYADFITLLFAFFTVLYATAQTDQSKLEAVVDAMTAAFEGGMPEAILDVMSLRSGSDLQAPHVNLQSSAEPDLSTLKQHLAGSLSDNVIQLGLFNQGINIVLPERLMFAPGNAELHPTAYSALSQIADALKPTPTRIEVIGHADGVPVNGGPYGDNWGLATARAVATVRYLERRGIPMERLTAIGAISPVPNPEARSVSFRIKLDSPSPTAEVLDRLYPEE